MYTYVYVYVHMYVYVYVYVHMYVYVYVHMYVYVYVYVYVSGAFWSHAGAFWSHAGAFAWATLCAGVICNPRIGGFLGCVIRTCANHGLAKRPRCNSRGNVS